MICKLRVISRSDFVNMIKHDFQKGHSTYNVEERLQEGSRATGTTAAAQLQAHLRPEGGNGDGGECVSRTWVGSRERGRERQASRMVPRLLGEALVWTLGSHGTCRHRAQPLGSI